MTIDTPTCAAIQLGERMADEQRVYDLDLHGKKLKVLKNLSKASYCIPSYCFD